ncbi:hypothetical protein [uncultured Gordonia sp.]|uniref:hypothetical protein n=1 Tax=uncultured Gordonia sp. TaxID=198437 RepID=UPI00258B37BC|nr:hypothetical protein [uncultured Gordonia sp.]
MTIPTTASHDEIIGRLIRQIDEVAGPNAFTSINLYSGDTWVTVHKIDEFRYPLHNADDPYAPVRIHDVGPDQRRNRCLTVKRTTLLKALQDAAATLAFPVTTGATLRVIDGGEPA